MPKQSKIKVSKFCKDNKHSACTKKCACKCHGGSKPKQPFYDKGGPNGPYSIVA